MSAARPQPPAATAEAPTGGPRPLTAGFFARSVHEVAVELIGCTLRVGEAAGVIVETEAYDATDPACHAYNGVTRRNEPLFGPPGIAYVYLSYGVHSLLNAVTQPQGSAAAVLIRALQPTAGTELMSARRGRDEVRELCSGPGKLTQALGVGLEHNGTALSSEPFTLLAPTPEWASIEIVSGPRIGITKAAERPWRHCAAGNSYVSRPML